jgi:hypothetical protein
MLLITIVVCLLGILLILVYGFYKIRGFQRLMVSEVQQRIPNFVFRNSRNEFGQLEALLGLFLELGISKSLPPTRGWAMSPDSLREIALYALHYRPEVIVECGSGVSTVILARCAAINKGGHVYSLEHLPELAERTSQELERHGLKDWATVMSGPLCPYELKGEEWPWYSIKALPSVGLDMVVIDGPPMETHNLARYPAGPLLFSKLNPAAAVFLDDSDREQERIILQRWADEFPEFRQEVRICEKGCVVLWKDARKHLEARATG